MIPLQHFAPSLVTEVLRRQPLSPGKLALAWQLAVGAQIARVTDVQIEERKGRGPTSYLIRVQARDARWASELTRARATVTERLKPLLGVDKLTLEITTH